MFITLCRQLRARRALLQLKDVPLRTRRGLLLYKVNGNSALLVLNGTSLICNSALLALSWWCHSCTLHRPTGLPTLAHLVRQSPTEKVHPNSPIMFNGRLSHTNLGPSLLVSNRSAYHKLRNRRVLSLFNDVYLRTEGGYCCTKSKVIAPFWFSTEHCCTALIPFWFSAGDVMSSPIWF